MIDLSQYTPIPGLLEDRVILVTGATQGIGRAASLELARYGAKVVLLGRSVKRLESIYDEIEANGYPKPAAAVLDLEKATDGDFARVAGEIEREFGRLDGIIHCATQFFGLTPIEQEPLDYWLSQLRVNVAAPMALNRACMPLLKESPDASIIMVSETHAHVPTPYWGGFSVSKQAAQFAVQIAAREWDNYTHLRINTLIPGPVHTPLRTKTHPGESRDSLPKVETLMPYFLYLIGPDSAGTTGAVLDCAAHGL